MASKFLKKLFSLVANVKTGAAALSLSTLASTVFENKHEINLNTPNICEDWVSLNKIVEERLTDFMDSLQAKIIHTSTNYRSNIQRRMDLFESEDPNESAELLLLKQQGDKMKIDLENFKDVALNSGYMAYHQAISSMHTGSNNPKNIVCGVYCQFEKMFKQQYSLNEEYERRLEVKNEGLKIGKHEVRFATPKKPVVENAKEFAKTTTK